MPKYATIIFDDGPREPMNEMVDKFLKFGFKASFAVVGNQINDQTVNQLRYAVNNGCELVLHGQNHLNFTNLEDKNQVIYEFLEPQNQILNRLGIKVNYARLPYLTGNDFVYETAKELGIVLLGQGIWGGADWDEKSTPEIIAKAVLDSMVDGAVACLHVNHRTLAALDVILPKLKEQGFVLLTTEELFKVKKITPVPAGVVIDNVNKI